MADVLAHNTDTAALADAAQAWTHHLLSDKKTRSSNRLFGKPTVSENFYSQMRNVDNILQLISKAVIQPQTPGLQATLKTILDMSKALNKHLDLHRRPPWFRSDSKLEQILARLSDASDTLIQSGEIQQTTAIVRLQGTVTLDGSVGFSNANFPAFFKSIDSWSTSESNIYLRPGRTTAEVTLTRNQSREVGDEVLVECTITSDNAAAQVALAKYLQGFSRPVDSVFRVRGTPRPSQIELESIVGGPGAMILWVCHNVFVRMELIRLRDPDASIQPIIDLAASLQTHVRNSFVATYEEAKIPDVEDITAPRLVTTGRIFTVEIRLKTRYFDTVICDGGNIVHVDSEDTPAGRKYTFLAANAGEGKINFYFAHRDTFNFACAAVPVKLRDAPPDTIKEKGGFGETSMKHL